MRARYIEIMRAAALTTIICMVAAALVSPPAQACSTFCFQSQDGPIFGRNYDWSVGVGMVVVNKRGVEKRSVSEDNPAHWDSRYGSVTFNQYGREFPNGGMNEAGLVVELMWLDETEYPAPDDRPSVTSLQWIQYQLDRAATVGEVIASDEEIRITQGGAGAIHFLVADESGACAAIEFLGGNMVVHTGRSMPLHALTNSTYEESLAWAQRYGGGATLPRTPRSLDRFVRAAHMADGFVGDSGTAIKHAFGILDDVKQAHTKWSIVYDIAARRIHFKTHAHKAVRYIDFAGLDFDCATPVKILDVDAPFRGDAAAHFVDYTYEANHRLVNTAFSQTRFLRDTPLDVIEQVAALPETMPCAAGASQ